MLAVPETVIVVDDDAAVRAALKFALEVEGFNVQLYDSPQAVLAAANLPKHGCLVIDYRMPAIDGIELVAELRRRNVALPAILISARVTKALHDLAARSGLISVLEKPLTDTTLVETIRGALASPV
jgi:two-component system response regulator FixJ